MTRIHPLTSWPIDARDRREAHHGGVIAWVHVSATPLPDVIESNDESAWLAWDEAVAAGTFPHIGDAA